MANLQVKSMDDQLYQALGKRAAMDQRSISQEVIFIIKDYLRIPKKTLVNYGVISLFEICI